MVTAFGVPRLVLTHVPHSEDGLALKRVTDIVLSAFALLVMLPVLAVIAIAIKLDDRGPVFFRQHRSGLQGKPFDMFKFRSMRTDAEEIRERLLHLNEMSGQSLKSPMTLCDTGGEVAPVNQPGRAAQVVESVSLRYELGCSPSTVALRGERV